MARRAISTDDKAIAKLWNAARPVMETTMPPFEPVILWTPELVKEYMTRHAFYIESPDLGFIMCQQNAIPWGKYAGEVCSEMSVWILKLGLDSTAQQKTLRALFSAWFTDHRGERVWGIVPESSAASSLGFLEDVGVREWAWERFDATRSDKFGSRSLGSWRLYVPQVPADWGSVRGGT